MTGASARAKDHGQTAVLLITRNFPPLVGGMERLMHHIFDELNVAHDVALVGPKGSEWQVTARSNVLSVRLSPLWRFFPSALMAAFRLAWRARPRLIIAGSGVTAPIALITARLWRAPVACYLHGLDLVADSLIYQALFVRAIRMCDVLIVNSHKTAAIAMEKGIGRSKIRILHPGVDIPRMPEYLDRRALRVRLGLREDAKVLLSVGRLTRRKGVAEFLDNVFEQLVRTDTAIHFLIIGEEPAHALMQGGGVRRRIEELVAARGLGGHVTLLGAVSDDVLRDAYFSADLLVFPAREIPGDVEGFGMVAAEAAAHGLPTVAFALGGIPDAVEDGVSGYLVRPGDYTGFATAILRYLEREDCNQWRARCVDFAQAFTWDKFGERLRAICKDTIAAHRGSRRR